MDDLGGDWCYKQNAQDILKGNDGEMNYIVLSAVQLEARQKDMVQDCRKTSVTTKPGLGGD